jgi:hypothetical protein
MTSAFAGLLAGSMAACATSTPAPTDMPAATAPAATTPTAATPAATEGHQGGTAASHACKGMNECKGQGGCSSGDGGCKGKNSCKGHGGCKT